MAVPDDSSARSPPIPPMMKGPSPERAATARSRRKRSSPWLERDQMAETHGRRLLIRGTPFKTVVAPVLAADTVMDKE